MLPRAGHATIRAREQQIETDTGRCEKLTLTFYSSQALNDKTFRLTRVQAMPYGLE
jgi:hypothetical protein